MKPCQRCGAFEGATDFEDRRGHSITICSSGACAKEFDDEQAAEENEAFEADLEDLYARWGR